MIRLLGHGILHDTVANEPAWRQAPARCGGMWFGQVLTSHPLSSDVFQEFGRHFSALAVSDVPGPGPPSKIPSPHPAYPVLAGRILSEGEPRDICRTWNLSFFRGLSEFAATFFVVSEGDDSRGMGQGMPEYHSLGNFPRYF
jgi:hypothetical protein